MTTSTAKKTKKKGEGKKKKAKTQKKDEESPDKAKKSSPTKRRKLSGRRTRSRSRSPRRSLHYRSHSRSPVRHRPDRSPPRPRGRKEEARNHRRQSPKRKLSSSVGAVISHDSDGEYNPEQILKNAVVASKVAVIPRPTRRERDANKSLILKAAADANRSVTQQRSKDLDDIHEKRRKLTEAKKRGELTSAKLVEINGEKRRQDASDRRKESLSERRRKDASDLEFIREKRQRLSGAKRTGEPELEKEELKSTDKGKRVQESEGRRKRKRSPSIEKVSSEEVRRVREVSEEKLPDLRQRLMEKRRARGREKVLSPDKKRAEDDLQEMRRDAIESMKRKQQSKKAQHQDPQRQPTNEDRIKAKQNQIEALKKVIHEIKDDTDDSDVDSSSSSSEDSSSSDSSDDAVSEDGMSKIIHSVATKKDDKKVSGGKEPNFIVTLDGIDGRSYFKKEDSEVGKGGLKLKKQDTPQTVYIKTNKTPPPQVSTELKKIEPRQSVKTLEERRESINRSASEKPKALVAPLRSSVSMRHDEKGDKPQRKRISAPERSPEPKAHYPSSSIHQKPAVTGSVCRYWPNCSRGSSCNYYHPSKRTTTPPMSKQDRYRWSSASSL